MTIAIDEGFTQSARAIGKQAGIDLRVATYPGVISMHDRATVAKNIEDVLVDQIVAQLTAREATVEDSADNAEPDDREIVFKGTFEEVNEHFQRNQWSDGLPIVPPTLEKVEAFLRHTDRAPSERLTQ